MRSNLWQRMRWHWGGERDLCLPFNVAPQLDQLVRRLGEARYYRVTRIVSPQEVWGKPIGLFASAEAAAEWTARMLAQNPWILSKPPAPLIRLVRSKYGLSEQTASEIVDTVWSANS